MAQNDKPRGEVLMAGIGGMGVLVSGQVLLESAFQNYTHVSYISSYGFARRGGLCECTVIFSDDKISSPVLDRAQVVMLLDSSQFGSFEHRVRPGGLIIAEKSGMKAEKSRDDYRLCVLPGLEIAIGMGSSVVNNLIMLGAYVTITGTVSSELVESELNKRFKEKENLLDRNLDAFRRGLELGKMAA